MDIRRLGMSFKKGQFVRSVLNDEHLMVIEIGREQIKCRTNDFKEVWFYTFELKED